jgi:hypothetical protein
MNRNKAAKDEKNRENMVQEKTGQAGGGAAWCADGAVRSGTK